MSTAVPSLTADEWRGRIASHFESKPEYLIPILQYLQAEGGYLSPESMLAAARFLRIPESKVLGVASFYAQFVFEPQGEHRITICRGTACHVKGSGRIETELCASLSVPPGGTTGDLLFTLEIVACVGACALAPVVVVNGEVFADQSVASVTEQVDKLRKQSEEAAEAEQAGAAEISTEA
ncbi:MAG: NAD(P)H-dependent oxidoreductase subunit E [bacterium]